MCVCVCVCVCKTEGYIHCHSLLTKTASSDETVTSMHKCAKRRVQKTGKFKTRFLFSVGVEPNWDLGRLIFEGSRSHTHTHTVGLP